jgi:eukaryotic-like serine/threonine-protein kinase
MLSPGDILGRYRILARLRAGGMATLYLAQRRGAAGFTRPVAIKVIHPHLASDPRFVQMFVDEARLSAKLDDPHIVRVEELGEEKGTYFLVMEYVAGVSLAQLLRALGERKRRLNVSIATGIAMQIAAGLHAAHEATDERGQPMSLVHRDVSPHNVLLAFKGHVKLIDFGIAKAIGQTKDTQTGSLRGKIAYMPPEQAFGRPVERRADVYALGIVLWEMLTMQRLFEADNDFALLERVRHPVVRPPSTLVVGIPPELDEVVLRALSPEPSGRPSTADELRAMLGAAVPSAVALSASDVATFLVAAMPASVEDSRRRLAAAGDDQRSLAEIEPRGSEAQEALATMTLDDPNATTLFADDERALPATGVADPPMAARPRNAVVALVLALVVGLLVLGSMALVLKHAAAPPAAAALTEEVRDPAAPAPPAVPVIPTQAALGPEGDEAAAPPRVSVSDAPPPPSPSAPTAARTRARGAATTKRAPRPAPSAAPAQVEMHGGVPIFNRGL